MHYTTLIIELISVLTLTLKAPTKERNLRISDNTVKPTENGVSGVAGFVLKFVSNVNPSNNAPRGQGCKN